ncbi:MAG: GNAT family N-acetyltransferase [Phycisphaerales bacterium]
MTILTPGAASAPADISGGLSVRLLSRADSFREITDLLHRAYRGQMAMGLRPLAGRQDADTTRRRCTSGECYVAVLGEAPAPGNGMLNGSNGHRGQSGVNGRNGHAQNTGPGAGTPRLTQSSVPAAGGGRIVGTILFHEVEDAKGPPWFQRPDVDSFSQFAVDPDIQGRGIGQLLLETAERRAAACGARELGLSMAEPDTKLMEWYLRRGYRFIEHWQWPYTNYRSAILSKTLG